MMFPSLVSRFDWHSQVLCEKTMEGRDELSAKLLWVMYKGRLQFESTSVESVQVSVVVEWKKEPTPNTKCFRTRGGHVEEIRGMAHHAS